MPRIQSTAGSSSSSAASQLLKRNQACHQCRRRKLKCDTQKPCTTCVKSHRFAAMNNPSLLDQEPECTYDQLLADGTPAVKPRTKYKALEDRIGELEAMLKAQPTQQPGSTHEDYLSSANTSLASESVLSASMSEQSEDDLSQYIPLINDPLPAEPSLYSNQLPQLSDYTSLASEQQLVWTEWPPRLPPSDLLNHLVEVFFNCCPHAHYLLHRPTFMASLTLPPRSPKFPHISLLHAICAYASVFSYLVDSPPMPNLDQARGDVIFGDRRNVAQATTESFADRHARWAKETRDEATALGFNLLECTQSVVISTGYYYLQGRWVELWMSGGSVLRYCVPLTLNNRMGYHTDGIAADSVDEASLLFHPANCVEREQRVNLFWIAYSNERFQTTPGAWAMSIDDEDVHQVLPYSISYYEAGQDTEEPRQTIRTPNVLLVHPRTIDSFTLYVKASVLLSRVKNLNLRIRYQHPDVNDIRELPKFQEVEQQVASFRKSFPSKYNDPVVQSSSGLDAHLYVAHSVPSLAMLLLHDKLADVCSPNCLSNQKALAATQECLSLVYAICSTSYDITRLLPICAYCWYKTGSFLVRTFKAQVDARRYAEAATTDAEIKTLQLAFSRMAQRIPLALRFMKMIDDEIKDGGLNRSQSIQSAAYQRTYEAHLSLSRLLSSQIISTAHGSSGCLTPQLNPIMDASHLEAASLPPSDLVSTSSEEFEQLFQFDPFPTLSK